MELNSNAVNIKVRKLLSECSSSSTVEIWTKRMNPNEKKEEDG